MWEDKREEMWEIGSGMAVVVVCFDLNPHSGWDGKVVVVEEEAVFAFSACHIPHASSTPDLRNTVRHGGTDTLTRNPHLQLN